MTTRRPLVIAALALFSLAAGRSAAIPPNPNYQFCWNRCQPGATCTTPCEGLFGATTCGVHWGGTATDYDSDGVANASDNCICASNSNQANCDGDSLGDACDSTDNSWTRTTIGTQACYITYGGSFFNETIKIYYRDLYTSTCSGSCSKKILVTEIGCGASASMQCCTSNWFYPDCTSIPWGFDNCGQPSCPF